MRPHGVSGELRVQAFAEGAPNLQQGSTVHVAGVPHRVVGTRFDRGAWLVRLEGVDSREAAAALQGELLEVADEDLAPLEPGVYYVKDLVGLRVVTVEGEELGRLTEVMETGANDVYVVAGERGEVLVPALGDVVVDVRLAEGVMVVDLPPGLAGG
ncbi:MAG: ribosome maturation factor RimM [Dehalococcoidia bacterium]